jgi:outer membrane protein TolC
LQTNKFIEELEDLIKENRMRTMNLFKRVFIAACALLALSSAYGQDSFSDSEPVDTLVLDLDQAIRIALSDNPTIKVADMEIEKADYANKEVIGNLFPNIGGTAGYTRNIKKQVMAGFNMDIGSTLGLYLKDIYDTLNMAPPQVDNSGSNEPLEIGTNNQWTMGFTAGMPLINVPLWESIKLTKEAVNSKIEEARASRIDMVASVTEAYYGILNAQDSYNVLLQSYDIALENLRIAKTRFDQGMASEYDVIQAEVQVKNLQPTLIATRNGIELATLQLKVLAGLPTDFPVKVTGTLSDYEQEMFEIVTINDVDTSLADNPNIRQLEVATRLLESQLKLEKAQWFPTLSLSATYLWISLNDNFKFKDYKFYPTSTVGITLSVPIFQGGSRYYKQKQAQIAYDEMAYTMENTKRLLRNQLQASIDQLIVSIKQIESTKETVALAEKGLSISQKRYEVGAGSSIELIYSENALTQSKLTYYQAIYDYIVAKNALDKVLGNAYEAYIN